MRGTYDDFTGSAVASFSTSLFRFTSFNLLGEKECDSKVNQNKGHT